jgi:hypothetical protein
MSDQPDSTGETRPGGTPRTGNGQRPAEPALSTSLANPRRIRL